MRKYFIVLILLIVGIRYGYIYLRSEKFQKYADKTKAPWTCYVTNIFGHMHAFMNEFDQAHGFFNQTLKRCPEHSTGEEAEYRVALCLEQLRRSQEAIAAYERYVEKHKGTRRTQIATRAIQILKGS